MKKNFIPFARSLIEDDEKREVLEVLESGWLTTGTKVRQLERDFAEYVGAKHAIAVNSGTAALHLCLDAIGIKEGDEVITTTFTFAATAEVIRYFKAKPVFVDIDENSFNIDPRLIEKRITDKTKAIIPVHFAGQACEMDAITEIAVKHGLHIVEDAAHALPTTFKGKKVGSLSELTCFSFYATKNITTGEGGMITTDNHEWAERMMIMSLHGISKDAWKRYTSEGSWYYEIIAPGYKYNLADIAAAIGIHQLKKCEHFYQIRKNYAKLYTEGFNNLEEIIPPFVEPNNQHAWHLYVIQIRPELLDINRSEFIEELRKRNIGASVHFIPLHLHPYYTKSYGYKRGDFPVAERVYERVISLPIYPAMKERDVATVIRAVKDIVTTHKI
jgi:perosamine synthetase